MSNSDYVSSGTTTGASSESSTLLGNSSAGGSGGWYARLSGLWCSVVSTLRSTGSVRLETAPSSDSKTSTTSSKTERSASTLSSCTETSDTWKYKGDDTTHVTGSEDGHTYYNLIEDFPYGGFSTTNGDPAAGVIVGEMFSEEEIFNQEDRQESIIPIQVVDSGHSV